MGSCLVEGSILLCWTAEAELASLSSRCDFSSKFVSLMFGLANSSLTLSVSSKGAISVSC